MSFNFGNGNGYGNGYNGNGYNGNGYNGNESFVQHLYRFVGQTVTVFTTSGGPSGCGFSGVLLAVNCNYIRLSTQLGTPPANPLSETICGDFDDCGRNGDSRNDNGYGSRDDGCDNGNRGRDSRHDRKERNNVGSVVDIPLEKIAAFCHNAV